MKLIIVMSDGAMLIRPTYLLLKFIHKKYLAEAQLRQCWSAATTTKRAWLKNYVKVGGSFITTFYAKFAYHFVILALP